MNVDSYLKSGHGVNIIQGSVSLDEKDPDGCKEIVPEFQHGIQKWWNDVTNRGRLSDGHVMG